MILAFPASRLGYFKVTGPVIEAAVRHGHRVRLFWRHDMKPGEMVSRKQLQRRWKATVITEPMRVDAVIGPTLHTHDLKAWAPARIVSLDYSWEQANAPVRPDLTQCYVTDYQRELAGGAGPVIGSTQLEAWQDARPMPLGSKPVLLLFSCKFRVGGWRRWAYRWVGYRSLLGRLRQWCDREGYALIVKSRPKHHDPRYVEQIVDRVYGESGVYPPLALRLMRSATVAVHFQSNAALELAHAGIPQYSVRLPQPHLRGYRTTPETYSGVEGTLGHWPGVIRLLTGAPDPYTLDSEALRGYRERYLGPEGASERVLRLLRD